MSKIDDLIEKLCPDGVEYKSLKSLAKIQTGKLNANAMVENGKYPFFTCNEKPYRIDTYAFEAEAILISGNGSKVGHVNYYKGKFNAYQRTYVLTQFSNDIQVTFLLHYLRGFIRDYIFSCAKKGSVPYITLPMLENFCLPVPPLEIQEEIVCVLDSFAELETELETELERRKAQYVYYRDQLLDFKNENVLAKSFCSNRPKYRQLKDIASYVKSKIDVESLPASSYVGVEDLKQNFQGRTACNIERHHSCSATEYIPGDILLGNIRPYLKKMWLSDSYGGASGDVLVIRPNDQKEIMSKFLWYCLTTDDFVSFIVRHSRGGKMPRGDKKMIMNYFVPVPPLEVQQRIVDILDKFDALVNDISQGLPAEIEARRKQYEYYRDKLLTFKEKVN